MARKKSEFLSTLGKLFEIFKAFVDEVIARGGSDEDITRILTDKTLRRKMVDLVLEVRVRTRKFLSAMHEVVLPARTDPFTPHAFFKTRRAGLYVWDGFMDRILAVA